MVGYPGQSKCLCLRMLCQTCSQPPPSKKIRCDKAVGHSLLIHYLGDLRQNINQSSPEGPLPYGGTTAVPCVGQEVGSLKAVQGFGIMPFISQGLSPESRVWTAEG